MNDATERIEEARPRRFRRYPEYKDSGIEWVGEIPAHWEVMRLGFNATFVVPMRDKPEDLSGDVPWIRIEDFDGQRIRESKSGQGVSASTIQDMNLKVFPVGTVLCSCSCNMGATAIVARPLVSNQTFIGIVAGERLAPEYVYYLMQVAKQHLTTLATGAIQQYLSRDDFSRLRMPLFLRTEQRAIAAFLDRETARIDGLVDRTERLIKLLQEKRTALITRAVTRGLDPNAPIKDSGVEWLGEIPVHWEVMPLKRLLSRCDYGISENLGGSGDIRVLTMAHIQQGEVELPDDGSISSVDRTMVLEFGDLLFNRTNSRELVGKVGMFRGNQGDHVTFASYLVRLTAREGVEPEWLNYLLNSSGVLGMARSMALLSVNQANLNPTKYQQIVVPTPVLSEQQTIAGYLRCETAKIDALIAKVRQAIDHLKEFRTALISAAVTGKIDVREEAS